MKIKPTDIAQGGATDGQGFRYDAVSGLWVPDTFIEVPAGGTAGQALVKVSGTDFDFDWGDVAAGGSATPLKRAMVTATANQSIPDSTTTFLNMWSTEQFDEGDWWSAANPSRLTVPAGVTKVRVLGSVVFAANATGIRQVVILKNGANFAGRPATGYNASSSGNYTTFMASGVLDVTPGDYFEFRVYQSSGGALNVLALDSSNWFGIEEVLDATTIISGGGGGGVVDPEPAYIWRIIFPFDVGNYSGATYIGFGEVKFEDSIGTLLSTGGTPRASRQLDSNWPASEAFDGTTNASDNGWLPSTFANTNLDWIGYQLGTQWQPAQVTVFPPYNFPTSFPTKFAVQFSNDGGLNWSTVGTYTTTTPSAGVGQTIVL